MKKEDERKLADEWRALQDKHASYMKFSSRNKNHRQPTIVKSTKLDMTEVLGPVPRDMPKNKGFTFKSVKMFGNATLKNDAELAEAKRILSSRAAPLYNKGGYAYVSDQDFIDLKMGSSRKHN